jgi:hypothetical protein
MMKHEDEVEAFRLVQEIDRKLDFALLCSPSRVWAEDQTAAPTSEAPRESSGSGSSMPPSAVIIDPLTIETVLGREVRSITDENMGRIVDIIVDRSGQVRAAIIDFGGFLGVGSRKIAVAVFRPVRLATSHNTSFQGFLDPACYSICNHSLIVRTTVEVEGLSPS